MEFEEIPEPTFVGATTHLGETIGSSLYDSLSEEEKKEYPKPQKPSTKHI
jgi:hypothetical protein